MGDGGGTGGAVGSPGSGADGKGSGNFDSYIGSLISLTSKSDIRYEGILYTIDAEKCNIALQNVRSYGTEGRKKEGPQIPPNDKVYDYIIFRGSDIKDLQVKSSPQVHAMHSQPYSDPAIIAQSQQSQQAQRISAPVVTPPMGVPQPPTGIPQPLSGFSHSPMGIPHGPVGVPSPSRDSSGHPGLLPPGFVSSSYPPAVGMGQWGPRPPPVGNGPMPMYWPGYYPPPTGSSMQPQYLHPLLPPEPPMQKLDHSLQDPTQGATANALVSGAVPAEPSRGLDKSRETASSIGTAGGLTPIVKLPRLPSVSQVPLETPLEMPRDAAAPGPVPAEQIPEPAKRAPDNSQQERPSSHPVPHHSSSSRDHQASENVRHHWRGNGRRGGRGRAGPTHRMQNFTEDFDFTAMNEKFKKDEVWGELGKVEPKSTEEEDLGDRNWQKADDLSIPKKPVYVKDDFFDSLSCDALDREGGHHERPRYSEQRKINTETFGDAFLRSRGGYRGNYKGGYHGRGGGYRRGRPHPAAGV